MIELAIEDLTGNYSVDVVLPTDLTSIPISAPLIGVTVATTLMTLWRIIDRAMYRRAWWDDVWAGLANLAIITFLVNWFFYKSDPGMSRLSILCSVIRLTPTPRSKKILYWIGVLFCVTWAVLTAQLFWVCEPERWWKELERPQCKLGKQVGLTQVPTDVIADIVLVIAPVRLFWRVKRIDRGTKIRLVAIFSASILTTIASLVHVGFLLQGGGLIEILAALLEDAVSLMVANLCVIVSSCYRLLRAGEDSDSSSVNTFFKAKTHRHCGNANQSHPSRRGPSTLTQLVHITEFGAFRDECCHGDGVPIHDAQLRDLEAGSTHSDVDLLPHTLAAFCDADLSRQTDGSGKP
ncbi:hypothetical protein BOTBODRAFT_106640 [Botryobasidium botryosum FD-172 SS1]|uniref:Rhodopsin domain-containing protein n=1 Tax=Botryobasidium botryosum (strain FD-172 SS1) TaxID=930990 RepID=A0A067MM65_BOTB1|nr:hypothetical protein BOTBODRAFT_106640 [Botryobasidium botryosum FD-172 SS1]